MESEKIKALYKEVKLSNLFYNMTPCNMMTVSSRFNWLKIYGKKKHNLPHNFYAQAVECNFILVCDRGKNPPEWIHSKRRLLYAPEISELKRHIGKERLLFDIPIQHPLPEFEHSIILSTEEVLDTATESIKSFILFNMDLFQ